MENSFCSAHSIRTPEEYAHGALGSGGIYAGRYDSYGTHCPGNGWTAVGPRSRHVCAVWWCRCPESRCDEASGNPMKAMKLIAYTAPVKLFRHIRAARLPVLKKICRILEANGIALEQKTRAWARWFTCTAMKSSEKLAKYQKLTTQEARRAVNEDGGVLGMFVTAEHDAPNVIHTMEIYRDRELSKNIRLPKHAKHI